MMRSFKNPADCAVAMGTNIWTLLLIGKVGFFFSNNNIISLVVVLVGTPLQHPQVRYSESLG